MKTFVRDGESKDESPHKFQTYASRLQTNGFVVIPREVINMSLVEVRNLYREQLQAARRILGEKWDDAEHVQELQNNAERTMSKSKFKTFVASYKKKLPLGLLNEKLLPAQLKLQLDRRINELYNYLFDALEISRDSDRNFINLQKSNLTLPGGDDESSLRTLYRQKGAIPHVDENPWAQQSPAEEFDYDFWNSPDAEFLRRPRERYRPIASFIALSDCQGGPNNGGMGFSSDRGAYAFLREHPIRGRNKKWGNGTTVRKTVSTLPKDATRKMIEKRQRAILSGLQYPSYSEGDIVMWMYNTVHSGPVNNVHPETIQSRMYMGLIPDCQLNRQFVRRQWGKYGDDIEEMDFNEDEKKRFGKID